MKKIIFGIGLFMVSLLARAQNGLESIIVEKYYVSNAADSIGAIGNGSNLPIGSVTYRIYADLLPGYKFQAAYGVPGHTLTLSSTTSFYTNTDRGDVTPAYSKTNAASNTVMLDSWLSVGGACTANFGILKSEDGAAGGTNVVNANGILANNDASAGIPLTTQDGIYSGAPEAVTFVGISNAELDFLSSSGTVGNLLTTSNGSWASLNGSVGPTSTNKVLIAQLTTNGVFHYELNIQIGTPSGGTENYVSSAPTGVEITIPSLTGTLGVANAAPTVSITSPANGTSFITGAVVPIAATAADADGTIASVEFFVNGVSVGLDNSSPYTANYTSVAGTHSLTARATDNTGAQTTSAAVSITVANNPPPTVSITSPANGASFITGTVVAISANASDNGSVATVEFFADGVSLGIDNASPYTANYTATAGNHNLTARATDNLGAQSTSPAIAITVANNPPPTVAITAPANGSSFITGSVLNITANAFDNGTVASVEFFVDGVSIGISNTAPYAASYTSVLGIHSLTARATDNLGAQTTSSAVSINIVSTILPYKVSTIADICLSNIFCLPVIAVNPVSNVIGYDAVMLYDKTKVTPTGVISVSSALINSSYVDIANSIDTANGSISISLFFNASAPQNAQFSGTGNVFCVEFSKTANFGSVDTATFSLPFIQESYFTGVLSQLADQGKYSTYQDSALKAAVHFWLDNSALRYDPLNPGQYLITNIYGNNSSCNSLSATAVQPDLGGNFEYTVNNGTNLSIQRDILGSTSMQAVINGFDAFLTRKVLVNDPAFTPSVYQMISMDVNLDGVISAGDLSQINQRAVLLIPEFKQAWNYSPGGTSNGQPSKDWEFIDETTVGSDPAYRISTTFPGNDGVGYSKARVPVPLFCLPIPILTNGGCPIINPEIYKGILVGDINGNYATVGSGGIYRQSASEKVIFDLSKAVIKDGYADVPVSVISDDQVNALDFAMELNSENISYSTVIDHTNYMQTLANLNAEDRTLRLTSYSTQNFELNKSLVSVRFELKSGQINESDLMSVEAFLNGEKVNTEVRGARFASSENDRLVSVYPNPASGLLNVLVSADATVQLLDLEGKQVVLETTVNADEKREISTQNISSGVYMMKIFNNDFVAVKRIVINK
ncbi:MAG: T9SS type A sorting domain-containing protein [Bacteroidia bacterium]|nr:T9SS type A sorting domain-containing protein [Bacteroidia bacterium]